MSTLVNRASHLVQPPDNTVLKIGNPAVQRVGNFGCAPAQCRIDLMRLGRQGIGQSGGAADENLVNLNGFGIQRPGHLAAPLAQHPCHFQRPLCQHFIQRFGT